MATQGLGLEITELRLGLPGAGPEKNEKKRMFSEVEVEGNSSNDNGKTQNRSQVVGWPPVCSYRKKNSFNGREMAKTYVKVSMDGAPFLRKIDLSAHGKGYPDLLMALEKLFGCFGIAEAMKDADGSEYVPIYEDRDGDWMLVGDVPWDAQDIRPPSQRFLPAQPTKIEEKMSPETAKSSPEFDTATELTLGLPGAPKSGTKRGFSETLELNLGSSSSATGCHSGSPDDELPENEISKAENPPKAKAQVVGWPPVRAFRKNIMKSCKYVKVAVDGAPYLRKVDLEMYSSYEQLLSALENMFTCFTICNVLNERKLMDPVNGMEYVPTYEDKDGDWMLVGDVPWKMFVESCKRLRLKKSSEASGLIGPYTPPRCSSSSC
ncbi:hypothetical protein RJ639_012093 [Escallonia herrerae]|uniref:Auxin-responsive protein n=1 Tax=Escallonia herrerae TaxID=1293975 RepID=A0AA89AQ62_9ASTE|nr:hypothetical protein RJ639_012093 [Escallonia herrerae]